MIDLGKLLLVAGFILAVVGGVLVLGVRIPLLGKLPGDIIVHKRNFTIYLPITTCVLLSLLLTLVLWMIRR